MRTLLILLLVLFNLDYANSQPDEVMLEKALFNMPVDMQRDFAESFRELAGLAVDLGVLNSK